MGSPGWTLNGNQLTTTYNVGVGTSTPAFPLDVNGDIGVNGVDAIRRDGSNAYVFPFGTKTANNDVVIGGGPGGNTNLLVPGGSVGVGTGTPAFPLDVNGDIGVNGVDAIRRDGNNAYIFPFGTRTLNNRVVIGGGPGGNTDLDVSGDIKLKDVFALHMDQDYAYIFPLGTQTPGNTVNIGGPLSGVVTLTVWGKLLCNNGAIFSSVNAEENIVVDGSDAYGFYVTNGFNGPKQAFMGLNVGDGGFFDLHGPGGLETVRLSGGVGAPDNGHVAVYDFASSTAGQYKAAMYVDSNGVGTIVAGIKSFRVPHPNEPDNDIVYACVEGPEAAAYVRGTAQLVNGVATISLPGHFAAIVGSENITTQLTPLSADSLGLAVVEKHSDRIIVRELHKGSGSYDFDWEIKGIRKGHENYQVVRPRTEGASLSRRAV